MCDLNVISMCDLNLKNYDFLKAMNESWNVWSQSDLDVWSEFQILWSLKSDEWKLECVISMCQQGPIYVTPPLCFGKEGVWRDYSLPNKRWTHMMNIIQVGFSLKQLPISRLCCLKSNVHSPQRLESDTSTRNSIVYVDKQRLHRVQLTQ